MVGEQVVLGWFILELTDSAFMVGVALGLRNFPLLTLRLECLHLGRGLGKATEAEPISG